MNEKPVALLLRESGHSRPRYLEVHGPAFTIGNALRADIRITNDRSRVRVRVLRTSDGWIAQNIAGATPGAPLRTVRLENRSRVRTAGLTIEFFTERIAPGTINEDLVARIEGLEREVVGAMGETADASARANEPSSASSLELATEINGARTAGLDETIEREGALPAGASVATTRANEASRDVVVVPANRSPRTRRRPKVPRRKIEIRARRVRESQPAPPPETCDEVSSKAIAAGRITEEPDAMRRARELVLRLEHLRLELERIPWM